MWYVAAGRRDRFSVREAAGPALPWKIQQADLRDGISPDERSGEGTPMQNSIWKLTSLAGVIAVTCLVILLIRQDAEQASLTQDDPSSGPMQEPRGEPSSALEAKEPSDGGTSSDSASQPADTLATAPSTRREGQPTLVDDPDWPPAQPEPASEPPSVRLAQADSYENLPATGIDFNSPAADENDVTDADLFERAETSRPENPQSSGPQFGNATTPQAPASSEPIRPQPDALEDVPEATGDLFLADDAPPASGSKIREDGGTPAQDDTGALEADGNPNSTETAGPALFAPETDAVPIPEATDTRVVQTGSAEAEDDENPFAIQPPENLASQSGSEVPASGADSTPADEHAPDEDAFPPLDFGATDPGQAGGPPRSASTQTLERESETSEPEQASQPDFVEGDPFGSVPIDLDNLPAGKSDADPDSPIADFPETPAGEAEAATDDPAQTQEPLEDDFPALPEVDADSSSASDKRSSDEETAQPTAEMSSEFPLVAEPAERPSETGAPEPDKRRGRASDAEDGALGPELGFPAVESDAAETTTEPAGKDRPTHPAGDTLEEPVPGRDERPVPLRLAPAPSAAPIPNAGTPDEPSEGQPRDSFVGDGVIDRQALPQTLRPQLQIQKSAPPKAVLGQPFVYHILIRNVGSTDAEQVVVEDRIPKGARLHGTIPRAELTDKKLIWKLGKLAAGDQKKISVKIVPHETGEIGSIATVTSVAEVGAATKVMAPRLELNVDAPGQLVIGESAVFQFRVRNTGSGAATNVYIREIIPQGLRHPAGSDLEYAVGTLKPGDSRKVQLTLQATSTGTVTNRAVATADGGVRTIVESQVEVAATQLVLERQGPAKRFVGRPATYENRVTNDSNQAVVNATVVEVIPEGLEFIEATDGGQFDPVKRTVVWQVRQLDPSQSKVFRVRVVPRESGDHTSVVQVFEARGGKTKTTSTTHVSGFTSLGLDVSEVERPVAVGERILMTVRARNRGTATAENVQLKLNVPRELEIQSIRRGDADVEYFVEENVVQMPPVSAIEGRGHVTFEVLLKAKAPADARLLVQVDADQMSRALSREEAILIVKD